ncbi:MAG: C-terminal binding protein [Beutenbergiaceae bacterium]
MFKVVKTDGVLGVGPQQRACFDGLEIDFHDRELLTEDALIGACADADALLVLREPITRKVIQTLDRCQVISRFGVGLDSIDLEAAAEAGIVVTNVPDSNAEEVATHALAMMLHLTRRLAQFDRGVRDQNWDAMSIGAGIRRPGATTVGIVGLGRIGRLVAQRAAALGFRIVGFDPLLEPEQIAQLGIVSSDLDTVFADADVVSLHIPLTAQTQNLVDAQRIARMKPGAILLNVSRGGIVDEQALAQALVDGHLGGAGLDALVDEPPAADHPLLRAPRTLFSPHAAHYSEQSYAEVRTRAFADVAAVLRGDQPRYAVSST